MKPADFVVSVASQLSGTLFAVVMFENLTLLGKLLCLASSEVPAADRRRPSETHTALWVLSQLGKSAKLVPPTVL